MKLYFTKDFSKSLAKLQRGSGAAKLAYEDVACARAMWKHEDKTYLQPTHNGEARIPHCVKYDLGSGYRLVTVEHEGQRFLLFAGSHSDTDQWIERHAGIRPTVGKKGRIDLVMDSTSVNEPPDPGGRDLDALHTAIGSIHDGLPDRVKELLALPDHVAKALKVIPLASLMDGGDAWDGLRALRYASDEQGTALEDILTHIGIGQVDEAITRAELYAGQASSAAAEIEAAIAAGTSSDTVIDASTVSDEELRRIIESHSYSDWLLYLTPAQRKHVVAHHAGPARLLGVSGSGKTCVAVHRARELAIRYPGERILVLVLNESLKTLMDRLLDELCTEEVRRTIRVQRIYDYCRDVVSRFMDTGRMRLEDKQTGESVEICWDQFTRRTQRKRVARLVADLTRKRVDPWGYLHDELTWIRSGIGASEDDRVGYLTVVREGRGNSINLPKAKPEHCSPRWEWGDPERTSTGFHADTRHRVLSVLADYEEYMDMGWLLDEDGMALKAHSLRDRIAEEPDLRARCVIVDECQDCSTIQLAVVAKVPTAQADGLLLVGDPAQKVFPKPQHLPSAGIEILGRSTVFRENYRNTREILEAAFPIVAQHRSTPGVNEADILPPEYARRRGPRPSLIRCEGIDEQRMVLRRLLDRFRLRPDLAICIGFPAATERMSREHYTIEQLQYVSKKGADNPVNKRERARELLPPETDPVDITTFGGAIAKHDGRVVVAEFDDMKGFEFSTVILVNLDDEHLYPGWVPDDERWRIAFQTYVAMTRARDSLWLVTAGEEASILDCSAEFLDSTTGADFLASTDS